MSGPSLILHIGAPKCGSSALQTALTRKPDHIDPSGRRLRYVTLGGGNKKYHPAYGDMVRRVGRSSPYGYACWPNFGPHINSQPILDAMHKVLKAGQKGGWVPILSCEGWINHPDIFAHKLAEWGNPSVDVVAFLRPPVEWMNAAWWQWGVWSVRNVDVWLNRQFLPYEFADNLQRWARIPNLNLHVRRSRPDVVHKFSQLSGAELQERSSGNVSSPASLIGFMLRNRRFRETPHDARAEFIFQRWCPEVPGNRLWALTPPHVRSMRPVTRHSRELLAKILKPEDRTDVFADPRWTSEEPYHDAIRSGISVLDNPTDLPSLHASLGAGIAAAWAAAGRKGPDLPDALRDTDPVAAWDGILNEMFDHLIKADARVRRAHALRWKWTWG
jgi:hypothetical protein